jgi:hypothetical protein
MVYYYHTAQGNAVLNKGDDFKLLNLGKFANMEQAQKACELHYKKVCKAALNFGRKPPQACYM